MTHTSSLHDFNKVLWNYVPESKDTSKNAVVVKGNAAYNEKGEMIAMYNRMPDLKMEEERREVKLLAVLSPLLAIAVAMVVVIAAVITIESLV